MNWIPAVSVSAASGAIAYLGLLAATGRFFRRVTIEVHIDRAEAILINVPVHTMLYLSRRAHEPFVVPASDLHAVRRNVTRGGAALHVITPRGRLVFWSTAHTFDDLHRWLSLLHQHAHCHRCGQNLTGVRSDRCPECGSPRAARVD